MPEGARRLHLVLNAKASADDRLRSAVARLRGGGHDVGVSVTWESGDARRFARAAARHGVDTVVACGGAGCSVGAIPSGTANDFALANRLPLDDPAAALDLVLATAPTDVDVGLLGDRVFLNVASAGVGAEIVSHTPQQLKDLLGGLAYSLTGLTRAFDVSSRPVRITSPDLTWEGRAYIVIVGNSRSAGGGYRVAPRAFLDDGLLDLVVLPEGLAADLPRIVGNLLDLAQDVDYRSAHYVQTAEVLVEAPEGLPVNLDGEPLTGERFAFSLLPGGMPFHLPPDSPLLSRARPPDRA